MIKLPLDTLVFAFTLFVCLIHIYILLLSVALTTRPACRVTCISMLLSNGSGAAE